MRIRRFFIEDFIYAQNNGKEKDLYKEKSEKKLREILSYEEKLIDKIKTNYRDKSAHRYEISHKKAEECLEAVLTGDDAIFKLLIEDMKDPYSE